MVISYCVVASLNLAIIAQAISAPSFPNFFNASFFSANYQKKKNNERA